MSVNLLCSNPDDTPILAAQSATTAPMVYIKRIELSRFKSFGNTTRIPLLPGFTVVSGPNGSGKSNILDALLFALGLASSRGMRAERLPDLVNHDRNNNGNRHAEATVTVTFDIAEVPEADAVALQHGGKNEQVVPGEWSVTRRLRVTKDGNYSSTYFINGQTCTQTEVHDRLKQLRIYPEGYNVVLQGDVTRIITMSPRERREIIDELAGVAEFDRKIERAKETLEGVKEREERCRIVEQELIRNRDRAASEREKAQKYRHLKAQIEQMQQHEAVMLWHCLQQQQQHLQREIATQEAESQRLEKLGENLNRELNETARQLEELNARVKALGEDEQLAAASQLATQEAQQTQLQQRIAELAGAIAQLEDAMTRTRQETREQQTLLDETEAQIEQLKARVPSLEAPVETAKASLEESKAKADEIAATSEAWVQQQTALSRRIREVGQILNPQRTELAQLEERQRQLKAKLAELNDAQIPADLEQRQAQLEQGTTQLQEAEQQVQVLARALATAETERQLQQETCDRLQQEQRQKQRLLDKLEATNQAQQEAQGTYATQAILQADIPGVCGLVAQLGSVEPRYQLALETAAGGRLANIVVEDDAVAAVGIELLKRQRAGRATFLPLNKIQPPRLNASNTLQSVGGFIDYAVNLVSRERRYDKIFAYVFGNTIVFENLETARPHLGKSRIVTLEGELLETSGALSGGSKNTRSTLHFGTGTAGESAEMIALRQRLREIETILTAVEGKLSQANEEIQRLAPTLNEAREQHKELQWRQEQEQKELTRLATERDRLLAQISQTQSELLQVEERLTLLSAEIPQQETQLHQLQQELAQLEAAQTHSEWQTMQSLIRQQETQLSEVQNSLNQAKEQLKASETEAFRLHEKLQTLAQREREYQQQHHELVGQHKTACQQEETIKAAIAQTRQTIDALGTQLQQIKQERDRSEASYRSLQHQQQQLQWNRSKLAETLAQKREAIATLSDNLSAQQAKLPQPLPELPPSQENWQTRLATLQGEIQTARGRLEAMEPVNMLAIEEYDRLQTRLEELTEKLTTLEGERTELLLRIENFTTRRFQAFQEAFDAVNANFAQIFAELSDGDGCLQLDNPEDIMNSSLNLVAHPKGKPVRRLHSMSGGEKSLTALSFIFALQRYRPSPFYAFDEVDMFLDGANVERLAKMLEKQARQAQFIVVSLRRPTIEASDRTIGVTQARGAYTQVLGIKL